MKCPVLVVTEYKERATDTQVFVVNESQKIIDYRNSNDRKWLANHSMWAMHNRRSVSMFPVSRNQDNTWSQLLVESN